MKQKFQKCLNSAFQKLTFSNFWAKLFIGAIQKKEEDKKILFIYNPDTRIFTWKVDEPRLNSLFLIWSKPLLWVSQLSEELPSHLTGEYKGGNITYFSIFKLHLISVPISLFPVLWVFQSISFTWEKDNLEY